ncbi:MAG: prepilin-type N-terminal cleavage/methylation domain-containing protein [Acidimicrobiia bacterium]
MRADIQRDDDEGFTLIELMVVVLVIAILLAIAIPTFLGARKRAQGAQARTNLRSVASAVATARSADGAMPSTTGALSALESSVTYTTAASSGPRVVSAAFASDHVSFAVKDNSGRCWSSTVSDVGVTESPVPAGWTCVGTVIEGAIGTGTISTFGGTGTQAFGGDGGPVSAASFNNPIGLATGSDGSVYVADVGNHRIRRIATDGTITTVAGNGTAGYSGDGGAATAATFNRPNDLVVASDGTIYVADANNNVVRKIATNGVVTTFAGNGTAASNGDGGPATSAAINRPQGLALDSSGRLVISDSNANKIRRVAADGTISTIVGTGAAGSSGDNGLATSATLNYPVGIAYGPNGELLIVDVNNSKVRAVDINGKIRTVVGTGTAGSSGLGGVGTQEQLNGPRRVAFDLAGNAYITELTGNRVV